VSTILVRCGDGVLVDTGSRWIFGRQPGTGGSVVVFVLGIVGSILLVNGLVQLVLGELLAFGVIAALAGVEPLLQLDFGTGTLLDATGRPLAPLGEVEFTSSMQLTSSARALRVRWNGGDVVVLRGDAFGGGIGPATDALRSRGLRA
jgi:hypothetical protein